MHQELSRKLLIWLYRKTCVSWWALEPLLECFLESGWEGLQRTLNQQESVWKYSSRWEEFPMQRKISLERTVEDLRDLLRHAKWEDIENEWSRDNEITVCFVDHNYPERLKQIDDPPPVLWCSRELSFEFWTQAIAVVGSRNSSVYGERVTQHFVHDFVTRYALTVVSGCAVGIDSCAHHACLASGGRTIGVLGTELTKVPHRVRRLFSHPNAILLSEWPPDFGGQSWNFARRNRLISGLSQGVLVIEAQEKSGTMLTVSSALEQGREVYVPPHSLWSKNVQGIAKLANSGAKIVLSASEIMGEISPEKSRQDSLGAVESSIVETLRAANGEMLLADLSLAKPGTIPSSEWWEAIQSLTQKGMIANTFGVVSLS